MRKYYLFICVVICLFFLTACAPDPGKTEYGKLVDIKINKQWVSCAEGSSGAGGAILGAIIAGPVGAIVGGLATRDKRQETKEVIKSIRLVIQLENKTKIVVIYRPVSELSRISMDYLDAMSQWEVGDVLYRNNITEIWTQ